MTAKRRKMSLRSGERGRVVLTYQTVGMAQPKIRIFYASGGYLFEDLPRGDEIMTLALKVCEGGKPPVLATSATLQQVVRREYRRFLDLCASNP